MREAWSSPTRTAARPGVMPLSESARTRSATSARICAAVALPSRIRAVTQESYRRSAPADVRLVTEMARPREYDRHAVRLRGAQDLVVALRPARVDHGRASRLRRDFEGIREGEERVARDDRALRAVPRLARRDPRRIDAGHLAGTDPDRRAIPREDDRVRLHAPRDRPREQQVVPLLV